ncbi:MAG: hypothetical protein KF767_00165 [Bdellovibrionaceae bacterium]|nr:hypothetical protein [Pseudobdellovibrionaceae bacterium]
MKFLRAVIAVMVLGALPAWGSFTLVDDTSGKRYRCSEVGGLGAADPSCIEKVRTYCRSNSSYSPNECFDKATKACGLGANMKDCVPKSHATCRSTTSFDSKACFDRALTGCGGL